MQFIDLAAQYRIHGAAIRRRIDAVLDHGAYIMGAEVAEFERSLAAYVGVRHAIGCANGTDALVLALRALGISAGDVVITSPFSFFATVEAILLVGARPVFADIDAATFNIAADALEISLARARAAGTPAKAVITVDLFGMPADYAKIEPICSHNGVALIEDAAQGFGGTQRGRRAGAFGTIGTTSFFPAKPLGCYGDGGALTTNDDGLAERLRSLRVHGKGDDKYDNVRVGLNSRLDTLQAAILLEKLAVFPVELELRQQVAARYDGGLPATLKLPHVPQDISSSWAQYSVLAADGDMRDRFMQALSSAGIPSMIYYRRPLHLQTALAGMGWSPGDFPYAEDVANRIFSLPMGPYLAPDDQDRVIEILGGVER